MLQPQRSGLEVTAFMLCLGWRKCGGRPTRNYAALPLQQAVAFAPHAATKRQRSCREAKGGAPRLTYLLAVDCLEGWFQQERAVDQMSWSQNRSHAKESVRDPSLDSAAGLQTACNRQPTTS